MDRIFLSHARRFDSEYFVHITRVYYSKSGLNCKKVDFILVDFLYL